MPVSKKVAAIYCTAQDELLRTIARAGAMKLGYNVVFLNPSLFNPLMAATRGHDLAVVPVLHGKCAELVRHYADQGTAVLLIGVPLFQDPKLVRVSPASTSWLPSLAGVARRRLELIGDPKPAARQRVKSQPILMLGQAPELNLSATDLRIWAIETLSTLRKLTDAPVVWRPDPKNIFALPGSDEFSDPSIEPLSQVLGRCWLAVTHSAKTSLDAVLAGMPLITEEAAMFSGVSYRLNQFGKVKKPTDEALSAALQAMSFIHWTREEIGTGEAIARILSWIGGEPVAADPKPTPKAEPKTVTADVESASAGPTEEPGGEPGTEDEKSAKKRAPAARKTRRSPRRPKAAQKGS